MVCLPPGEAVGYTYNAEGEGDGKVAESNGNAGHQSPFKLFHESNLARCCCKGFITVNQSLTERTSLYTDTGEISTVLESLIKVEKVEFLT